SLLMAVIYRYIPDDLSLADDQVQEQSKEMFRFFRGDRAVLSLDQTLPANKVGHKAATLSQLRRWGYPVPMGWVLPPGDDPQPLIASLHPDAEHPLAVRSSAIGEDSEAGSAAGIYDSILHVTSQAALEQAILRCQTSYGTATAIQYRRDRHLPEDGMAVLVQVQVQGVFSGVAFSRDPITRQGDAVVIEALPGMASRVVSGRFTPDQYRVWDVEAIASSHGDAPLPEPLWLLPEDWNLPLEGDGDVPPRLIQQVAYLARQLERHYHGVPQDVEWTYDGQHLWVLQSRPITTLLPIWTRKIAAEVIPGFIHPLTWSINRPLTCGVWGDLFTIVLGDRARGLDFSQTATLHHSAAYFNASLLGQTFLRMGLPPESLEFLTRGEKFSKPPLASTLRNTPGLLRLLRRELRLLKDFRRDDQTHFQPLLTELAQQPAQSRSPAQLLERIEQILAVLRRATYYSILAPLSLAIRQAIAKAPDSALDNSQSPEVASLRSLQQLAEQIAVIVPATDKLDETTLFSLLSEHPDGRSRLAQFERFVADYGYLSQVATDIAVPRWRDDPQPIRALLAQQVQSLLEAEQQSATPRSPIPKRRSRLQQRLDLKGRVTEVYSRLLAELRWSFVALEQSAIAEGWLQAEGDIFFLTWDEIQQWVQHPGDGAALRAQIAARRAALEGDRQQTAVPRLVYGNDPPAMVRPQSTALAQATPSTRLLRGIGASPGYVEGPVLVLRSLQSVPAFDRTTILVVPYTDSGWAPLLARAAGIIAEVGGRLSHGAIVAREYGIPAVMDIHDATQRLQDGQRVRLDGLQGTVEIV
ncbi:MAG TPA: PEP/pyruvate-binding domain-containing protein, partial [Chroococcidiopsis sp.]